MDADPGRADATLPTAADHPGPPARVVALVAVGLFVVVLAIHALSPVRTPSDSAATVPLAVALVSERTFDVSRVLPEAQWRDSYLYEVRDDGAVVTRYPVGPVVLALPVVAAADLAGIDVGARVRENTTFPQFEATVASVVVALTAVALFLLATRRLARIVPAAVIAVVFAFGTSAWSTASRALWQHGPVMLCFTLAMLALADAPGGPRRASGPTPTGRLVAAGLALGAAVWCRPVAVMVLVVFAAWAMLRERRRGLWLVGAGILPVVLLAGLGALAFDDPNPLRYPQDPKLTLEVIGRGIAANLVSPSRGILIYTPVVLLGIGGIVVGLRRRTFGDLEWCALASAAVLVGAAAANPVWWAGFAYGPRLLTDLLPFAAVVCLPLAACWPRSARAVTPVGAAALAGVAVLVLWGVAVHARGALVDETWAWNTDPVNIDTDPDRAWDWSQPQLLAGTRFVTPGPSDR